MTISFCYHFPAFVQSTHTCQTWPPWALFQWPPFLPWLSPPPRTTSAAPGPQGSLTRFLHCQLLVVPPLSQPATAEPRPITVSTAPGPQGSPARLPHCQPLVVPSLSQPATGEPHTNHRHNFLSPWTTGFPCQDLTVPVAGTVFSGSACWVPLYVWSMFRSHPPPWPLQDQLQGYPSPNITIYISPPLLHPKQKDKLTGGLDSSVMASLFFSYFSRTILSAWMAVSRMVRYFLASSRMGLVSICEGVRLHLSLNCSRSCLSDFSSSSSDCRLWDRAGRVSQHKWLKLYYCSTTSLRKTRLNSSSPHFHGPLGPVL